MLSGVGLSTRLLELLPGPSEGRREWGGLAENGGDVTSGGRGQSGRGRSPVSLRRGRVRHGWTGRQTTRCRSTWGADWERGPRPPPCRTGERKPWRAHRRGPGSRERLSNGGRGPERPGGIMACERLDNGGATVGCEEPTAARVCRGVGVAAGPAAGAGGARRGVTLSVGRSPRREPLGLGGGAGWEAQPPRPAGGRRRGAAERSRRAGGPRGEAGRRVPAGARRGGRCGRYPGPRGAAEEVSAWGVGAGGAGGPWRCLQFGAYGCSALPGAHAAGHLVVTRAARPGERQRAAPRRRGRDEDRHSPGRGQVPPRGGVSRMKRGCAGGGARAGAVPGSADGRGKQAASSCRCHRSERGTAGEGGRPLGARGGQRTGAGRGAPVGRGGDGAGGGVAAAAGPTGAGAPNAAGGAPSAQRGSGGEVGRPQPGTGRRPGRPGPRADRVSRPARPVGCAYAARARQRAGRGLRDM